MFETTLPGFFPFWYQLPKPTVGDSKASMCLWDTSQEISMEHYPQSLWAASEEAAWVELRLLLVAHDGAFSAAFWPKCLPPRTWSRFGPGFKHLKVRWNSCLVVFKCLLLCLMLTTFQRWEYFQKLTGVLISCWNASTSLAVQASSAVKAVRIPDRQSSFWAYFENQAELTAARWPRKIPQ